MLALRGVEVPRFMVLEPRLVLVVPVEEGRLPLEALPEDCGRTYSELERDGRLLLGEV